MTPPGEPWRRYRRHQLRRADEHTPEGALLVGRFAIRRGTVWVVAHRYEIRPGVVEFDLVGATTPTRRLRVMPGDYVEVPR